ncbi:hypothetical protein JB92DRAFT_89146 [Gautieria morchelliformis]|nr:hypothetical protein JB92DRAFT_89146 [Gautieria morchelliformis]
MLKVTPRTADRALLAHYKDIGGASPLYLPLDMSAPPSAHYLTSRATYYRYVILNGRRYTTAPHNSETRASNASLVKAQLNDKSLYGEITSIFEHLQPGYPPFLFAEIRWFKTLQDCPLETDVYAVILFEKIVCHLARGILPRTDPPQWITITLDKMRTE